MRYARNPQYDPHSFQKGSQMCAQLNQDMTRDMQIVKILATGLGEILLITSIVLFANRIKKKKAK